MDGSLGATARPQTVRTACPHDCPSACVLEVERLSPARIGRRVRGAAAYDYTAGTCCAKVARYAERAHHPDRLSHPLLRVGAKGEGRFARIGWDEALDRIAGAFQAAAARHGPEAVWPYHSGGNMGVLQRYGLDRLRHAMGYSRQKTTICITPAEMGWKAGMGGARGTDPRRIAEADLVLMWGGNPVSTQVNLMHHVQRARRRGGTFVVVDAYRSPSVEAADIGVVLRPGTDAALALALMAMALEAGAADREFLARHTDFDEGVERHIRSHTPAWAAGMTGVPEEEIRALGRLYAGTRRMFLRAGVGFTRHRNGAATMHAVSCLPAVTGAWGAEGGGGFFYALDGWGLDTTLAWGTDRLDLRTRVLDQSRIGAVLNGDPDALRGGPPVAAMLIQNANSAEVAPDSAAVRRGLARESLFLAVHEQFPTPTAMLADVVLPATTFLEHDDLYLGLGHTAITVGPRAIEPHAEARSNHAVVCGLAARLGAEHPGFGMTEVEVLDATLRASDRGGWEAAVAAGWLPAANGIPSGEGFAGFPHADGRFRFRPDWAALGPYGAGMPAVPSFWAAPLEAADAGHPFRLITPPARGFLNTSFTETPGSRRREGPPRLRLHPEDADRLGVAEGATVRMGNRRGAVTLLAARSDGVRPGVVALEGISPSADFPEGIGVNALVGADPVPPAGGVAFHDTAVWVQPA